MANKQFIWLHQIIEFSYAMCPLPRLFLTFWLEMVHFGVYSDTITYMLMIDPLSELGDLVSGNIEERKRKHQ